MSVFLAWLADLFGADRFAAHSLCLSSDPVVIWAYDLTNLAIAWSYGAIALTFVLNGRDVLHFIRFIFYRPASIWVYALFIAFCGIGHGTMSLTMHLGVYYLDLLVNFATAGVSVVLQGANSLVVAFLGAMTTLGGGVLTYLATRRKTDSDDHLAGRKSLDERFDKLVDTLQEERAELLKIVREQTGRIDAQADRIRDQSGEISKLTATVYELKSYVGKLVGELRALGKEPPPPPQEW